MLTEFGKVMRIIRINTGDSMRDMAAKIGMSATYLSAIETGKRNIPANMEELLFSHYNFSDKDKKKIKDVVAEAAKTVGAPVTLKQYVRFALGEGIEKKQDDFAAEVAAAVGK